MAKKQRRKAGRPAGTPARRSTADSGSLQFSARNGLLALAGLVSLSVGFALLAQGSVTAAPLLLVLGYVVLLPLAIIL